MSKQPKLTAAILALAAFGVGSCDQPADAPLHPAPVLLTGAWQRIVIGDDERCVEQLACLLGRSETGRPTMVSVKQTRFDEIRGFDACMPTVEIPGLTSRDISFGSYTEAAQATGVSSACPAYGRDPIAQTVATPYENWQRSDYRHTFEAWNSLGYIFLPLGSRELAGGRHIQCIILYDSSGMSGEPPRLDLRTAANTCATLFYFREKR